MNPVDQLIQWIKRLEIYHENAVTKGDIFCLSFYVLFFFLGKFKNTFIYISNIYIDWIYLQRLLEKDAQKKTLSQ